MLAGQPLRARHLRALEYTGQVVQEALRLHSPIWMLTRNAVTEVRLGTHQVPAGAELFFSPYALQRDPRTFPEPESFDPDRWLPGAVCPRAREAHLPFGAGASSHLHERGLAVLATLDQVAAEQSTTVAAVALAWLAGQPTVVAPIASARTVEQLADLLPVAELTLTADQLTRLTASSAP